MGAYSMRLFLTFRPGRTRLSIIRPPTRIRAGIRTDYVVVSPHIIRVRIHKILTLNVTALTGRYYILIGCFVPKHPDTLNPNGNSIIHSEAAHAASSFMWNRGPSGAPLP